MGTANNIISTLAVTVMWILVLLVYNYFIQKPLDSKSGYGSWRIVQHWQNMPLLVILSCFKVFIKSHI